MMQSPTEEHLDGDTLVLHLSGEGRDELITLEPSGGAWAIGRARTTRVHLDHEAVSRSHAEFLHRDGTWFIRDAGSTHGTIVNGVRLDPAVPVEIGPGDEIAIRPFLLRSPDGRGLAPSTVVTPADDTADATGAISAVPDSQLQQLAARRLSLFMDAIASVQGNESVPDLLKTLLSALLAGTDFSRALFVRPLREDFREIELLAEEQGYGGSSAAVTRAPSRSLLEAASHGRLVRLDQQPDLRAAESIMTAGVESALCAPVRVGDTIEMYAYLDASGIEGADGSDAAAFCSAIAWLAGLALSNVRRAGLERKQARMVAEMRSAREVQRRLMPEEHGSVAGVEWSIVAEPGTIVAGDLGGIRATPTGGALVYLGDVCGKGAGAGMLMAYLQSRVDALAGTFDDPVALVTALNAALEPVTDPREFVTLWMTSIDCANDRACFVDAGHGYALLVPHDGPPVRLDGPAFERGVPLAVTNLPYPVCEVPFRPADRILVFSDGLVEQRGSDGEEFGWEGVLSVIADSGRDVTPQQLLEALRVFANGAALQDDVTIIAISR